MSLVLLIVLMIPLVILVAQIIGGVLGFVVGLAFHAVRGVVRLVFGMKVRPVVPKVGK
jgi:hypothetical protein